MKIIADENIPLLDAFFSDMSHELIKLPGRDMSAADVHDADVLLVRSITKVNEALLKGSAVKFVGTCTIGTDHIDQEYLAKHKIAFRNAPGCNANAVVDYVLSALTCLAQARGKVFTDFSVGIMGAGNVGGRLYKTLIALGMDVCIYDPFIEEFSDSALKKKVFSQNIVSLHTPITYDGEHKTHYLVDKKQLETMQANACLINSCRGLVVNNADLLSHLKINPDFEAVMDVWEDEPAPSDELLETCFLATPHIAGYSLDGKYNGTSMIYESLCEFLALPKRLKLAQLIDEPCLRKISFSKESQSEYQLVKTIRNAYDIRDDHFRMMGLLRLSDTEKAQTFDGLRKKYPYRRDRQCLVVSGRGLDETKLAALDVKLKK